MEQERSGIGQIVTELLEDERFRSALALSVRDVLMCEGFRQMRREGLRSGEAITRIADQYCLSEERVRTVVYTRRRRSDGEETY